MSKTQDFLFEFSRRSYEREEQGNDAILRTLPFFATSLGALLAGLAVMGGRIESLPPDRVPLAYELLGLVLILALVAIVCIGVAVVFTRDALLIASAIQVVERAQELNVLHNGANPSATEAAIDDMVLFDLRVGLIQEMSIAAVENRLANVSRMRWLKSAIAALTASLIVAFVTMFGLLASSGTRTDHGKNQTNAVANRATQPGNGAGREQGAAPATDVGAAAVGPVVPPRAPR
jgi:hypothetical protein